MAFIKVIKNRSYFIRYQVKYRRRREGKTDYQARRRLVIQDKNKYNTPKYRLVVRFTNKDVIAQVIAAKIEGDFVYAAAYGHELTKYGIPVGHSNYAAAYAVGLLVARRTLKKAHLDDKYLGQAVVSGDDFNVVPVADGPRPFRAFLDTGLKRTSTGSKVFATLKGACDGGLDIPHSVSRYVGYDSEAKKLKPDVLRKHIFGAHVAQHMRELKEEDSASFERKFSRYLKAKVSPDDIEKLYTKAHAQIRQDPSPSTEKKPERTEHKRFHKKKLTLVQRKSSLAQRKRTLTRQVAEAKKAKALEEGDDDEDEGGDDDDEEADE